MKLNLFLSTLVVICATSLFGQDEAIKEDAVQLTEREEQLVTLRKQFKDEIQNEMEDLLTNFELHVEKVAKQKWDLASIE